jgi:hypothetical protein
MPLDGNATLVTVVIDKPRRLRFDFNAFASYEEVTGKSILAEGFQEGLNSVRGLRALLWAALLHEDPNLTLTDVGAMLHLGNARQVSDSVQAALGAALPDQEPEGNAPAAGQRRGGRTSGP